MHVRAHRAPVATQKWTAIAQQQRNPARPGGTADVASANAALCDRLRLGRGMSGPISAAGARNGWRGRSHAPVRAAAARRRRCRCACAHAPAEPIWCASAKAATHLGLVPAAVGVAAHARLGLRCQLLCQRLAAPLLLFQLRLQLLHPAPRRSTVLAAACRHLALSQQATLHAIVMEHARAMQVSSVHRACAALCIVHRCDDGAAAHSKTSMRALCLRII